MQQDRIQPMVGIGRELNIQFALGYEPGRVRRVASGDRRRATSTSAPLVTGTVGIDGVPQAFADLAEPGRPRQDPRRTVTDSFPRQSARTQRFTLGEPRNVTVSPDGRRVVFARSRAGDDPVNCLWVLDVDTGDERARRRSHAAARRRRRGRPPARGAGPARAGPRRRPAASSPTPPTPRWWRPPSPSAAGCSSPACVSAAARELDGAGPGVRPATRPDGAPRRLRQRAPACASPSSTARPRGGRPSEATDDADVSWGSAEFIAAEEMGRSRGYWWSPDGEPLAVARVDTSPVGALVDRRPGRPGDRRRPSSPTRRPAPTTPSSPSTCVGLDGRRVEVDWDRQRFPYLVDVRWAEPDGRCSSPCSRATSAALEVLRRRPDDGAHRRRCSSTPTSRGWSWSPGAPGRLGDGRLVTAADRDGARRLLVDGAAVTPADLQVRAVVDAGGDDVVFTANALDEPTEQHVWRWTRRRRRSSG